MTLKKKEMLAGILLAAPFLLGFLIFYILPFIVSLSYTVMQGNTFVGFANYTEIFHSAAFHLAAWNTFRFILIAVPLIMIISFGLSMLLFQKMKGFSFFRSVFLFPLILPIASSVMVFQVFLSESGILNTLLNALHMPIHDWLGSSDAFYVLIFLYIWKNTGYNIILFLAGLQAIPSEYYSIANLEGGTGWKSFRYITMPLMVPYLFFVVVISIMNSFKSFREAYLLSGDYPNSSIYLLQHFMNNNFSNLNYQHLSIAALLVFLVIFILVFILFRLRQRMGDYEI